MKKNTTRISANEINRFLYCPYQWYYKKTYGAAELTRRYKALKKPKSQHEHHFAKGLKHHAQYHRNYQLKRLAQAIVLLASIGAGIGVSVLWR